MFVHFEHLCFTGLMIGCVCVCARQIIICNTFYPSYCFICLKYKAVDSCSIKVVMYCMFGAPVFHWVSYWLCVHCQIIICSAFYPNYFFKKEFDEMEAIKSLSNHDPLNTVMVGPCQGGSCGYVSVAF